MPDATTQPNGDYLSKIVTQGGMVRADTNGKSGPELARLQVIQEERKKDAENLVREFLEQVSFDPYYKATLNSWYAGAGGADSQGAAGRQQRYSGGHQDPYRTDR